MSSIHEPLLAIVKERRSAYVKSLRWLLLSMVTLLAFQVLIFDPFVAAQTRLAEVKQEQGVYGPIARNIEKRREAYGELGARLSGEVERRLASMMDNIAEDLQFLTLEVALYLDLGEGAGTGGRDPVFDPMHGVQSKAMQVGPLSMPPPRELGLNEEERAALREAQSWSEARELLQGKVEDEVVAVRFSEYNAGIREFVDEAIADIEKLNTWNPKGLKSLPPELQRLWADVEAASDAMVAKMRSLQISTPEDERWWWTSGGKQGIEGLELQRSNRMIDRLMEDAGYEAVLASIESQLQVLVAAEAEVMQRQEDIEVAFLSFQETIAQLLGPLDWLPLNLEEFVFLMPLLVSCSFGLGVAWIMSKRSRYNDVLHTSASRSETVKELEFTLRLDAAPRRVVGGLLLCMAAGLGWIVYANLQLMDLVGSLEAGRIAHASSIAYSVFLNWVLSLLILLGASAWSFLQLRRVGGPVGE
ncbi:hypothetical protein [Pelagicoccus sp. SDUM812005]|uniref:hypothetical protein n=1 Tax=Pelagicoccus sp. SDUM812005 TaxID=3041257 RepID=UPI00280EC1FB|nr:hypothetical protein [Pelagicoccus sp. SDUM812005]MDQ8183326.1 hypothetical protein [Pelagicoccus sp. SDUM812005]